MTQHKYENPPPIRLPITTDPADDNIKSNSLCTVDMAIIRDKFAYNSPAWIVWNHAIKVKNKSVRKRADKLIHEFKKMYAPDGTYIPEHLRHQAS